MPEQRKLAAILAADVVGYSRLTSTDEEGTLARMRSLRSDLIDPTVDAHHGRVVKRTGDGALVEFRSVVEAVRCAIVVQDAMVERNAGLPSERRIEFRMGVHLGDVVEESDGDLMGDGVNIAARLEGVAEPGAICLSEDAYRQVRSRIDLSVSDLGETKLKNIAEPVRIYSLKTGSSATTKQAPAAEPVKAASLPDKPSIAVLPFTNMSGDLEQEYFVDGMVEDIITALSRFNQLFVIARNSSFVYKGSAVDVKQVGRELGVRYVLEGSVRKAGSRVRITGQLIDATTGAHLWADRFDGELEDVFDLQDRITASVIGAIEPTMRKAEIERSRLKPADNLGAYDLYLQALPLIYAIREDDNRKALDLLFKAIDLDPSYAPALAHAAWCFVQRITRAWPPISEAKDAGEDDLATATSLARRALAAGPDDAVSIALGGFTLVMLKQDYATGLDAARRAVDLNSGSGFVNAMAGCALIFGGDLEAGLSLLERTMALGPLDPNFFSHLTVTAYGQLFNGRPDLAAELAERSLALNAQWDSTYWVLIAAYTQLDRLPEAKTAAARLLALSPQATIDKYRRNLPIRNPASLEIVLDGLRQAGLPDGA